MNSIESKDSAITAQVNTQKIPGPIFNEIGSMGLKHSYGTVQEDFIPRLRWPRAGAVYQEMSLNDPVITAILLCSRQLIRNITWSVEPASDSQADVAAAQFVDECRNDMSLTWTDLINDITSFFEYGFSFHEIVYKKRLGTRSKTGNSTYDDGRIGWRKIAGRAQHSMTRWEFDEHDGLKGMYQIVGGKEYFIPIERALLFRTTSAGGNPEGRSFLRGAYRPWYFKKHIEEIEGIGIERDLAGLPVITAPEGLDLFNPDNESATAAKNNALALVSSIRRDRNEGVVLPAGWELKLLSSQSGRTFDTNAVINRYDQRIAITMLADIVMLGADKVGSFALAKTKQSMLAAALDAQVKDIVDIFNRYAIPRLMSLNIFPGITGNPKLVASQVITPDLKELGDYVRALSGTNLSLWPDMKLENYLRSVANLPIITEEDAAKRAPVQNKNNQNTNKDEEEKDDGSSENKDEEGGE